LTEIALSAEAAVPPQAAEGGAINGNVRWERIFEETLQNADSRDGLSWGN
jgi:hypothetical protein